MWRQSRSIATRISKWKKKTVIVGDCWRYTGAHMPDGYGLVNWKGRPLRMSRVVAHIFHGLDLTKGHHEQGNHKSECKFKDCWNPDHIYVGSQKDNMQDAIEAGTHRCVNQ